MITASKGNDFSLPTGTLGSLYKLYKNEFVTGPVQIEKGDLAINMYVVLT